ncbi:hypothetical protein GCM10008965_02460 [Methylorubrum aminovorans]|nr:hypothetical protein GCM10025880_24400 [Methylorubrum aminovorans]
MLHQWVKQAAADPQHAFPGKGQMKPEQIEIDRDLTGILDRASCEATAWWWPWVAGRPDPES